MYRVLRRWAASGTACGESTVFKVDWGKGAMCRYVVEGSIEERMLKLQESKRELVSSAFERRSPDQQRAMRINDIKLLMQL